VSRKTLIDRNIELLDYELECNQRFVNEQREAQTFKPIPSGNVDKLIKLMSTLKLPEVTPGYSIQVIREFMEYIENQDLKLAKSILSLADKFVVEQTVKGQ
jgi:hypothetical protein